MPHPALVGCGFLFGGKMKKLALLFFIITAKLLYGDMFFAQLKDVITKEGVSMAIVKIDNEKKVYYSDDAGKIFIRDLASGKHKMSISRIGYNKLTVDFDFPKKNNLIIYLSPQPEQLHGITINQSWANEKNTPITFENITQNEINNKYIGQDPNLLVNDITNVYSYTESGSGLGYSHIKVRGFDEKRIGVMVNGIPLNDPEDHQVYWVDIPDIGENIQNIQFQRGVGNLIYGISTLGGSLNLETEKFNMNNEAKVSLFYGSYNTKKLSLGINRKLSPLYSMNLRLSFLDSDGYRKHSATNLKSGFISLSRLGEKSTMNVNLYGGKELTDASWYASSETDLKLDHKHNPITYPNEIDEFLQPHFELHHSYFLNDYITLNNSVFYIYGNGYYKQLKKNRDPWEYSLIQEENDTLEVDLVRKKNVTKNQLGWVFNSKIQHKKGNLLFGGYFSGFKSKHWGEVDSISVDIENFYSGKKYYEYHGNKNYYTFYLQEKFGISKNLNLMVNFQSMNIEYHFKQLPVGNFKNELLNRYKISYHFFNPSFGLSYNLNNKSIFYFSLAKESREPTDDELYDLWKGPDDIGVHPLFAENDTIYSSNGEIKYIKWEKPYVKPENLIDFELGSRIKWGVTNFRINFFQMFFKNEIVAYGGADDDGNPIRGNAEETIHRGVELSFSSSLPYNFSLNGNFSFNHNYFKKFIMHTWDQDWNVITKDYSGKKLAGFPEILSKISLSYEIDNFKVMGEINYFGRQYLDNENLISRSIEPYFITNSQINYVLKNIKILKEAAIVLRLNNLFNKKYETSGYYDSWYNENYYWPGAEFNITMGLKIKF